MVVLAGATHLQIWPIEVKILMLIYILISNIYIDIINIAEAIIELLNNINHEVLKKDIETTSSGSDLDD
jgi:hypothetical protein